MSEPNRLMTIYRMPKPPSDGEVVVVIDETLAMDARNHWECGTEPRDRSLSALYAAMRAIVEAVRARGERG